jgi:hypothetical protein
VELSFGPVLQIQNVYERTAQSSGYEELFSDGAGSPASYDYVLETPCFLIRTTDTGYKNWPKGIGAVKVTYTAGYATVPKDLELAVADIVKVLLQLLGKAHRHLLFVTIQVFQTTFAVFWICIGISSE